MSEEKSSNTVSVACKWPNGIMIHLMETGPGDPSNPLQSHMRVTLNGSNHPDAIAGYGITKVDKDFMDKWMEEYANHSLVRSGTIFVQKSQSHAEGQAKEQNKEGISTGLEPLKQEGDSRAPKDVQKADKE